VSTVAQWFGGVPEFGSYDGSSSYIIKPEKLTKREEALQQKVADYEFSLKMRQKKYRKLVFKEEKRIKREIRKAEKAKKRRGKKDWSKSQSFLDRVNRWRKAEKAKKTKKKARGEAAPADGALAPLPPTGEDLSVAPGEWDYEDEDEGEDEDDAPSGPIPENMKMPLLIGAVAVAAVLILRR
jgi:hypothetical protein